MTKAKNSEAAACSCQALPQSCQMLDGQVRDREERYHQTFLNSIDNMFTLEPKTGKIRDVSISSSKTFGYSRDEFLRMNISDLDPTAKKWLKKADKKNFYTETQFICKDGSKLAIELDIKYLNLSKGPILHSHARNITKQKDGGDELREAYKTLRYILDRAPFGIYIIDSKGCIDYVNPKMLKIAGDTYKQFKEMNIFQLPTYRKIGLDKKIRGVFNGKIFHLGPIEYISYFGGKSSIRVFIGIPLVEHGEHKALMFVEDVTEQEKAEETLKRAYNELKMLDQIRSDFVHGASHALKTPLTSITSFIGLLCDENMGPVNPRQKEVLEIVYAEARRLDRLITHILDSSKIEGEGFILSKSKIDLAGMVSESLVRVAGMAKSHGNKIAFKHKGRIWATTDPLWVEKVIDNLLHNALKFTKNGYVRITLEKKNGKIRFSIRDTGCGITKTNLQRIFEKFYRVDPRITIGTGLGLYISKKVVEAHGGKIGGSSRGLGKGSTFWFTLPIASSSSHSK